MSRIASMRHLIDIIEGVTLVEAVGQIRVYGRKLPVLRNPAPPQLVKFLNAAAEQQVRGLLVDDTSFWWDGGYANHFDVAPLVGDPNRHGTNRMTLRVENTPEGRRPVLFAANTMFDKLVSTPAMRSLLAGDAIQLLDRSESTVPPRFHTIPFAELQRRVGAA
jgi:hypothetical protein